MTASAVERRAKGPLRRIEAHRREALEEANPALAIDNSASMPVAFAAQPGEPAGTEMPQVGYEPDRILDIADAATTDRARKDGPADQCELADHCIAHPGDMTPNQRRLLVQLFNSPSARELYELKGGKVDELRNLLTATASGSCALPSGIKGNRP